MVQSESAEGPAKRSEVKVVLSADVYLAARALLTFGVRIGQTSGFFQNKSQKFQVDPGVFYLAVFPAAFRS